MTHAIDYRDWAPDAAAVSLDGRVPLRMAVFRDDADPGGLISYPWDHSDLARLAGERGLAPTGRWAECRRSGETIYRDLWATSDGTLVIGLPSRVGASEARQLARDADVALPGRATAADRMRAALAAAIAETLASYRRAAP